MSKRWLGLIAIALGVAMIIVDVTIVNVSVPSIIRDLGATSSDAQWIQETYTLVFVALLLVSGRLADRHGRRRLFLLGVTVFTLASVLCAVAPTPLALIGGRVLQGVGGAMILPTSLSLLNATFTGRDRGIAFAVWGSTIGGTAALGPLLGGWLTTSFSWRWAFGINVPIGILVLAGTLLLVAESRDPSPSRGNDWIGSLLSIIACGAIVFGLIEGRTYGWFTAIGSLSLFGGLSPVPVAFALGVVAAAAFIFWSRRRVRLEQPVLLDLRLFEIRSFRNGNLVAGVVSLGEFGLLFALPLWAQNVLGYSAFETGLVLLPLAAGSFAASGFAAPLAGRFGPAWTVRLGILLECAGVTLIGIVAAPDTRWYAITPPLFVYGLGVGLATAQVTGVVLADVPVSVSGQAASTQSTTRQLGSALGIAVLGTILFSTLAAHLNSGLSSLPPGQRSQIVTAVRNSAGAAISGLSANPAVEAVAKQSFATATRWTAFTAATFLALGFIAALRLGSRRPSPAAAPEPPPAHLS